MSSRALRRAQRELEEKKQLEQLAQEKVEEEEDDDGAFVPAAKSKPSLFAMLGGEDDGDEDDEDVEPTTSNNVENNEELAHASKPTKKSKKKKKKGKSKSKASTTAETSAKSQAMMGLDEIDQALLALKVTSDGKSGETSEDAFPAVSEEKKHLYSALSVDTQHLHAANEMKKLFGRSATDDEPRARRRGAQGGIAAAMAGRGAPGNRNLASLGLRRNIFIQGKEEWPRATSGGLGMEIVEKRSDGTVEYRFVHNTTYQSIQQQFDTCVASMDPERMVQLLHFNPYHISTLLQVSEIAKQQRDNATAGELLERALFSLGRAVHSTFSHNLSQGKARLDFRRPENREFWLAVWRYIGSLGVRATWRTAFEWAKLLLSMSPEDDPYCIRLQIDQLALRGREPQALVDIVESDHLQRAWKIPPNLAFSVALAHDRLKNPQEARKALRLAIKEYPWIASRLCKELDISPIPKPVWGKEPNGDDQELLTQLYVTHAKDLWNTTEGTTLLVEVCYSMEEALGAGDNPYWLAEFNELDIARHVILSDDRALLNLLDSRIKSKYTSTSDPLPPEDSINSYSTSVGGSAAPRIAGLGQTQLFSELERLRQYFQGVNLEDVATRDNQPTEEDLLRALERAGTSIEEFRQNTERLQQIRPRLHELGVDVVFENARDSEGDSDG
ncbi:DUF654-domain-containing protein [Periconia macrospinosa]|uniref:DUF654-domain-containing protein n=1 Tax=Periconia macrospinosa TaxID=97972 RepID=A0A2V1D743_9PLEO|nr:DUF654-domain-containing protein [Periconia macrospinosa]